MIRPLSIAIAPAVLMVLHPVLTAAPRIGDAPESFESVMLETGDKLKIHASFYAPRGKNDRKPGVLLVHDAGGDCTDFRSMAETLQKRGFGVLALDVRGHGANAHDEIDWAKLDEDGRTRLWAFAMRDVAAGAQYLRTRKEIHASNLTIVGLGAGCSLAARYASRDENVRAVVLIEPGGESYGYDLSSDLAELGGLPTLIVSEKSNRTNALRLSEAGHQANSGQNYIQVATFKTGGPCVIQHKRVPTEVAGWLKDTVEPKRGG